MWSEQHKKELTTKINRKRCQQHLCVHLEMPLKRTIVFSCKSGKINVNKVAKNKLKNKAIETCLESVYLLDFLNTNKC